MTITIISHPDCLRHEMGEHHPESPNRLRAINAALKKASFYDDVKEIEAPLITRQQLERVHDKKYVDEIFRLSPEKGLISIDPDTYMNPHSLSAALRAAGAVIKAVDLVLSNESSVVFCNIRPPGHHAERAKAMGFCFFNNVAIGAAYALDVYQLSRVAIIDFDVHHGNGTEDIFKDNKKVLICSSFQSPFYPFTGMDTSNDHIINLPLPAGTNGETLKENVQKNWLKALKEFSPELIFFSAGFDGYYLDPLADFQLKEEDYFWLTKEIKKIADNCCAGKIISILEGGYHLEGIGRCVISHLKALL